MNVNSLSNRGFCRDRETDKGQLLQPLSNRSSQIPRAQEIISIAHVSQSSCPVCSRCSQRKAPLACTPTGDAPPSQRTKKVSATVKVRSVIETAPVGARERKTRSEGKQNRTARWPTDNCV